MSAFEFRGSLFTLPVLRLLNSDLEAIRAALQQKCEQAPGFFEGAPVVLELGALDETARVLDFRALGTVLRACGMVPVGVREANAEQEERARKAGFAVLRGGGKPSRETPAKPAPPEVQQAMVVAQVRSGQQVYAQGRDLIVMGSVNEGGEVIADGHIHVYGTLRGRARAGARGDVGAMIFALGLHPESVTIGDELLLLEDQEAALKGRPGRVSLKDGRLMLHPL